MTTSTRFANVSLLVALALVTLISIGCATGRDDRPDDDREAMLREGTEDRTLHSNVEGMESPRPEPVGSDTSGSSMQNFDETVPVGSLPSKDWPLEKLEQNARTIMSNVERRELAALDQPSNRRAYLRESGIAAKVDMAVMLNEGMSLADVRARFPQDLGHVWNEQPVRYGVSERWMFKRYNGAGYTVMITTFTDDSLVRWNSYAEQIVAAESEIRAEAARLKQQLDAVLEPVLLQNEGGVAIEALPQYLQTWSLNRALALYPSEEDTTPTPRPETAGWREQRAIFFSQLQSWELISAPRNPDTDDEFAEAYQITLAEPDETSSEASRLIYRYDQQFADRTLNIYLVFDERKLTNWYVEPQPE